MAIINYEFKARTSKLDKLEQKLLSLKPKSIGEDQPTDTYVNVTKGRLKLRGNIENSLIWYQRENTTGSKKSDVLLYQHEPYNTPKDILIKLHGNKVIVRRKERSLSW